MPEYIEREAANEALRECVRVYSNSFYNGIEVARTAIRKLPAVDAVEVVRCKDCRFLGIKDFVYGYCENPCGLHGIVRPESYCSRGEREEE